MAVIARNEPRRSPFDRLRANGETREHSPFDGLRANGETPQRWPFDGLRANGCVRPARVRAGPFVVSPWRGHHGRTGMVPLALSLSKGERSSRASVKTRR